MQPPSAPSHLIIGCGYLGLRVARLWQAEGHTVAALTRSQQRAEGLEKMGIVPVLGDVTQAETLGFLPPVETVLHAVGYDRQAAATKADVYINGLSNVLSAIAGHTPRFVYISSSSVYGQDSGEWVNEASPANSQTESGQICREAERLVEAAIQNGLPATILRLTGIYGPDRVLAKIDALRNRVPLTGSAESWLNLIHVDDAAAAAVRAAELLAAGSLVGTKTGLAPLYLVSDDRPITRGEYYRTLAALVGAPEPVFDESQPAKRGSGGLNKRADNTLLKRDLLPTLNYPTIDEGLRASVGT